MTLDLTDEEKLALAAELKRTINEDRYPLSPRIRTLKAILAKLKPAPAVTTEPRPTSKAGRSASQGGAAHHEATSTRSHR